MEVRIEGITLLSKEEYQANQDLIKNIGYWWWLRTPVPEYPYDVYYIHEEYGFLYEGRPVCNFRGAVRPALILQTNNLPLGSKINYHDEIFTVLRDGLALCDRIITRMAFREDDKTNVFEESDVYKYINMWFGRQGEIAETVED